MRLMRFAVSQPVLANLVGLSIVIVGVLVAQDMRRESLPIMPTGWASVWATYPGASALEVEQLVTEPIEAAVANVEDIKLVQSVSREGLSQVFMQFEPHVEDLDSAVLQLSNEINRIDTLPARADRPVVSEFQVTYPAIAVAIRGDVPPAVLQQLGRDLTDVLERVDMVADVRQDGIRGREIAIEVDPERLAAFHLPLRSVADALRVRSSNLPAGTVEGDGAATLVRGLSQVDTAELARAVVVRPDAAGGSVHVGDVADVSEGYAEAIVSGRANGEPAIVLTINKEEAGDSIDIAEDVRAVVASVQSELPPGVTVETFGDGSSIVRRSLDTLYSNMAVGLLLVLALLWFFIGGRNAIMAAVGLPVAFAGAFLAMNALDITISMVSMMALILCLGIVVDDAIIIIENVYRHMEEGMSRRQAAIVGTSEVFWPVVASTATTVAAFLPLMMMTGVMGRFFAIIPKVIIVALLASLIEAFFILPSHLADFGRVTRPKEGQGASQRPETSLERLGRRFMAAYERGLRTALRHRHKTILAAYALAIGLAVLAGATKEVVLFNDQDVDMLDVRVHMPTDASREQTEEVVREVERRLLAMGNEDLEATVAARGMSRNPMGAAFGDHLGMVTAYMVPAQERSSVNGGKDYLQQSLHLFDDIVGPSSLEVVEFKQGPPMGAPVAIRVSGDELDRVVELSEQVAGELRSFRGVRDVSDDYDLGKRELQIEVDEDRAALHGLTPPAVLAWMRNAFGGSPVATTRDGDEEIDIMVRLSDEARSDPSRVANLTLIAPDGTDVALQDIATITYARGPGVIRHRDRRRTVTITAHVDDTLTTGGQVNREMLHRLEPLVAANPELTFTFGGQFEETQKSLDSLARAFVIAAMLIYTILATIFRSFAQPLVVMAAIPLSFIGVVIGFFVSGSPVGLVALIGVVGLSGIVVNDSLVLVDFINQRRQGGMSTDEAIVAASRLRVRPILLTSVTTVAGIFPLAMAGNAAATISPMATAIAWGLSFATVLTLVIIPCLYKATDDFTRRGLKLFGPLLRWLMDPGDAVDDTSSNVEVEPAE